MRALAQDLTCKQNMAHGPDEYHTAVSSLDSKQGLASTV